MKIYVSEKDFKNIDFNDTIDIELLSDVDVVVWDEDGAYDVIEELKEETKIKSLEQHDKEIKKQVIEELEGFINNHSGHIKMGSQVTNKPAVPTHLLQDKLNQMKGEE